MDNLLIKLIKRGDVVSIEQGRIVIGTPSSLPITSKQKWIDKNQFRLFREIARLTGDDILYFQGYKTGQYGKHLAGGVTLQFLGLASGRNYYTVFNVSLERIRTTVKNKAGSPLPDGQFRVTKSSKFYAFWLTTGLKTPPRLSSFHDYMGKLSKVFFIGNCFKGDRLEKDSIKPYAISYQQLKTFILPDNCQTTSRQLPDNIQTSKPNKQTEQTQPYQRVKTESATCENSYDISKQGSAYTRTNDIPDNNTNDEWLNDYFNDTDR